MFDAVLYEARDGSYVGFVRQLPGAYAQGATVAELLRNLRDAKELALRRIETENRANFAGLGLREIGNQPLD
jgi:predicted RNase H-like HicB family nuclease